MKILSPVLILLFCQIATAATVAVPVTPPLPVGQVGGTAWTVSACSKVNNQGVAICNQVSTSNKYRCPGTLPRLNLQCINTITQPYDSAGNFYPGNTVDSRAGVYLATRALATDIDEFNVVTIYPKVAIDNYDGRTTDGTVIKYADGTVQSYPGAYYVTRLFNGQSYGCQTLQSTGSGGHVEPSPIGGCGRLITTDEYNAIPRTPDGLLAPALPLWVAPTRGPHYESGYALFSYDRNEVTDVSSRGFVLTDVQVGNSAYYMNGPQLCDQVCQSLSFPVVGINNLGDAVGGKTAVIGGVTYDLSTYGVIWTGDINDKGDIAGQCQTPTGNKGCIVSFHTAGGPPVQPPILIGAPVLPAGQVGTAYQATLVSGGRVPYAIAVSAGALPAGLVVSTAGILSGTPTAASASSFSIRVMDNARQNAVGTFSITIAAVPPPPPGSTAVDSFGTITAIGEDFIQIGTVNVYFNSATTIKFNDVSSFAVGLRAQYKGIMSAGGVITATSLEIN
jgi:hypothetical protein